MKICKTAESLKIVLDLNCLLCLLHQMLIVLQYIFRKGIK